MTICHPECNEGSMFVILNLIQNLEMISLDPASLHGRATSDVAGRQVRDDNVKIKTIIIL
ncbi:hypothetical protein CO051_02030 [Candidatus Roizmanbacteria bacterium CG_4_9_14_0_2_um_filter_39_13]|uniref:Uncharacterized protein n=2 Tax=Candidatus Roizmaniibacteriota TaxID=1752723 RepID=A0A2M8F1C3_9BACT|nr:MAG: hypothetical protein CO051_02030 [Candidatus Roizmanbacteria bacterium CG_4_9_14_0_2_um_filter_39_13]PJE62000.1 MAG: hypothetical protein COU87_01630 [Candidatus Roizmanbacteria bacterium CG10_big_fil_rev_8_21_14_0_10_39_12]